MPRCDGRERPAPINATWPASKGFPPSLVSGRGIHTCISAASFRSLARAKSPSRGKRSEPATASCANPRPAPDGTLAFLFLWETLHVKQAAMVPLPAPSSIGDIACQLTGGDRKGVSIGNELRDHGKGSRVGVSKQIRLRGSRVLRRV
jgi:hypothetical protein